MENSASSNDNCDFDSLRVFDSFKDEATHGELLGSFCGSSTPPPLLFAGGKMVLVFKSDRSLGGTGFSAKFEPVDMRSDCDRTFTAASGEVRFDSADYSRDVDECVYQIRLPATHRILLKISNISLPCGESSLEVRNGASEDSPGFPGLHGDSEVCDDYPVPQLIRLAFFRSG